MSDDKPPLKLLVEPDEYLCTWLLPAADGVVGEYAGALNLRPGRPPVGSVHGDVPIQWVKTPDGQGAGFPQESRLPHLRARLANGYDVDLVDARVSYWSAEHGRVSAASATVGLPPGPRGFGWKIGWASDEEVDAASDSSVPTYSRVSVQVGALDAIAGASPFSGWRFPKEGGQHLEGDWSVAGNPDSSQDWSDDDVTVRLEYDTGVGIGNRYSFRFVVSPVVRIESTQALAVSDWVERWVAPLRRIASIATGCAQALTYLAVDPTGVNESGAGAHRRRQVYGSGIAQDPYQSNEATVSKSSTVIYIAEDGLSLLDMLRRWQRLEDEHHPLIETYGAMLAATEEHPRSRFLLLVQALEGLYGHTSAEDYAKRQARHTEKRETLLEAIKAAGVVDAKQRKFLTNNLARRPLRGLDEALRRLLVELPIDLTPRLAACDLLAEYLVDAEGPQVQQVAFAISRVRNDLAHGNRGFDTYNLSEAVAILERVVRAHALRLLGCPDMVLERVCDLNR